MNKVAVYGSLRKGFGNHVLLEHVESHKKGKTVDVPFTMYHLGGFPAIVQDADGGAVVVEVYDVDDATFARLDRLEGYPSFYDRMEVDVDLEDGSTDTAWIYFHTDTPTYHSGTVHNNDWLNS